MKKNNRIILSILVAPFVFGCMVTACKKDAAEDPNAPYLVTQEDLDKATYVTSTADTMITGNPFKEQSPIAAALIRDVYTNFDKQRESRKGDILVIKGFEVLPNGKRGKLILADIMVKRENNFNPAGKNYEFIRIMYDATVDYSKHPNGILPDVSRADIRGKGTNVGGTNCISCHLLRDDFVFTN